MLDENEFKRRLIAARIVRPTDIIGCSDAEIAQLESAAHVRFPDSYIRFLRTAGKKAGDFLDDVDIYYDDVRRGLNAEAIDILDNWENGALKLPENAFVYSMRYGEQFTFFIADGIMDDPPIYFYYEGHGEFKKIAESLWEDIESELAFLEDIRRRHPHDPFLFSYDE